VKDLFKEKGSFVNVEKQSEYRKYLFVPLKKNFPGSYSIDFKLLQKVKMIAERGYSSPILPNLKEDMTTIQKRILVKASNPHICYTFSRLLSNLPEMPLEELAAELKVHPESLTGQNAFDAIFNGATHLRTLIHFREDLFKESKEGEKLIRESPICLLQPTKPID